MRWRGWYGLGICRNRRCEQLQRQLLCALCLERGKTTSSVVADHVERHGGNWNRFVLGRLQSLCRHCHDSRKRQIELRGYDTTIGEDGWPTDPHHPANQQR